MLLCRFRGSAIYHSFDVKSCVLIFIGLVEMIFEFVNTLRNTKFVQKVSGLTTGHEVGKAYGVLTLLVFNTVPFRSYTLRPTFLPPLETI